MAAEYEARGPGERGRSIIPNHAAAGDLAEGCAPERVGPAESWPCPIPVEQSGRINRRCLLCQSDLAPVPCDANDPQNGSRSDTYCDPCKPIVTRDWRQELGLVLDCEQCGKQLEIDGVCPACHIGHDGPRCVDCGNHGVHRSDCPKIQPPTVDDLIAEANLTALGLKPLPGQVGL